MKHETRSNGIASGSGQGKLPMRLAPIAAFLWGEFFLNIGRGYLLVVFTQFLFRASGNLWQNLLYVTSDVIFAFVVPFFAGSWIDRNGPDRLLCRSTAGTAVLLWVYAALIFGGSGSSLGMLSVCLATGMLNASVRVCVFAITPALASANELMRINGRQQFAFQSGNLLGVLLAGLVVDHISLAQSFTLVGACAAFATIFYSKAARGVEKADIPSRDVRGGFLRLASSLVHTPLLAAMFALGACDLIAISLFNLTLPILAASQLHGQSFGMAMADSTFTAGCVVLGWIVGRYALKGRQLHFLLLLMPFALVGMVSQTIWFNWTACLCVAFLTGLLVASYTVYFSATIQALVPAHLRGRFAALRRMVSTTVVSGASYAFTAAYTAHSLRGAAVATAAIALAMVAGCIAWIVMRRQPADVAERFVDSEEHGDLKPLFASFLRIASGAGK